MQHPREVQVIALRLTANDREELRRFIEYMRLAEADVPPPLAYWAVYGRWPARADQLLEP